MTMPKIVCIVAAGLLTISLASCTDSGGDDSGSAIKIMALGQFDAPQIGFAFPEIPDAVNAAVKAKNGAGGIKGKDVEVIECNDNGDANKAGACARKAVEEKVAAVVGRSDPVAGGPNIRPVLEAAGIPDIGVQPSDSGDYTDDVEFPIDGGTVALYAALGQTMTAGGCKNIAPLRVDQPVAVTSAVALKAGVTEAGGTPMKDLSAGNGLADYSSVVSNGLNAGADCFAVMMQSSEAAKAIIAIRDSGKDVKIGSVTNIVDARTIGQLGADAEGIVVSSTAPAISTDDPTVQNYLADLKAADGDSKPTAVAMQAWSAAQVFFQAAEKVDGDVTASSIKAVLDAGMEADLGYTKFSFKTNDSKEVSRIFNFEAFAYTVNGGAYTDQQQVNTRSALVG